MLNTNSQKATGRVARSTCPSSTSYSVPLKDSYSSVCEEATADERGNEAEPLLSARQVCEIGRVGLNAAVSGGGRAT